jgi:phage terminase large subunit-like protein
MARAMGESFWPERFPEDVLEKLKAEKNAYAWSAQYLQIPGVRGGAIIKREWWKLWRGDYPELGTVVVSVDTAYEEGDANSWNAVTAWGAFAGVSGEPLFLLLEGWRDRIPLAQLVERVARTCRERRADYLLIEHKSRGRDLHDEVRRLYAEATWETVLVKPGSLDKTSRLQAVSHLFSGDVKRMPDGTHDEVGRPNYIETWSGGIVYAPDRDWADEVIAEVSSFPYGTYDDYVDTVSLALSWCRKNGVVLRKVEWDAMEEERMRYRKPVGVPYAIKPVGAR